MGNKDTLYLPWCLFIVVKWSAFILLCVCSSSARGFKTAELQIPGGAQSVEGAQQLGNAAHRSPLQGNVSTHDNWCVCSCRVCPVKVTPPASQFIRLVWLMCPEGLNKWLKIHSAFLWALDSAQRSAVKMWLDLIAFRRLDKHVKTVSRLQMSNVVLTRLHLQLSTEMPPLVNTP